MFDINMHTLWGIKNDQIPGFYNQQRTVSDRIIIIS